MASHDVKVYRRLYGASIHPYDDLWAISIDGVKMNMELRLTLRFSSDGETPTYFLKFGNKGVSKHPDYKEMRSKVLALISVRYKNQDKVKLSEVPPDEV